MMRSHIGKNSTLKSFHSSLFYKRLEHPVTTEIEASLSKTDHFVRVYSESKINELWKTSDTLLTIDGTHKVLVVDGVCLVWLRMSGVSQTEQDCDTQVSLPTTS